MKWNVYFPPFVIEIFQGKRRLLSKILRRRRRRARRLPLQLHELGEDPDHGRRVVRAGLGLHVRAALVVEDVLAVGPADDGADEVVWVLPPRAVPRVEPLQAADEVPVVTVRRARRRAVVHLPRVRRAVPDQVAGAHRIRAQDVVGLGLGERQHLAGVAGGGGLAVVVARAAAAEGLVEGGEDVGVDGEEEGRAGGVLEVVPGADEEQPRRGAAGVVLRAAGVPVHARAHVVLRLGPQLLHHRHLLRAQPQPLLLRLHQQL